MYSYHDIVRHRQDRKACQRQEGSPSTTFARQISQQNNPEWQRGDKGNNDRLRNKSGAGFTLVESLVAITILLVAIVAPMSIAHQGLMAARYSQNYTTAVWLAAEAVEYVRGIRDENFLRGVAWTSGLHVDQGPFIVDVAAGSTDLCSGSCDALSFNNAANAQYYGYGSGSDWEETSFVRTVEIVEHSGEVETNSDEIEISVSVEWTSPLYSRTYTVKENLYKWSN